MKDKGLRLLYTKQPVIPYDQQYPLLPTQASNVNVHQGLYEVKLVPFLRITGSLRMDMKEVEDMRANEN